MTAVHPVFAEHGSFASMKLGRKPRVEGRPTLKLRDYLAPDVLANLPAAVDWTTKVTNWGMMGNDTLGDCTCAAVGHQIEVWTANATSQVTPADGEIETFYWLTGSPPSTTGTAGGPTDDGRDEQSVLASWESPGLQLGTAYDKILTYVEIDTSDYDYYRAAIALFGGAYLGVALPLTAQGQTVWDVVGDGKTGDSAPGSWGGHAIPGVAYQQSGMSTIITWGAPLDMTQPFFEVYVEEAYVPVSVDWLEANGGAPSGLDLVQLQADASQLAEAA